LAQVRAGKPGQGEFSSAGNPRLKATRGCSVSTEAERFSQFYKASPILSLLSRGEGGGGYRSRRRRI
jgi:hypothetical protein